MRAYRDFCCECSEVPKTSLTEVTGRAVGKVLVPSLQIMQVRSRIEKVDVLFERLALVPQRTLNMPILGGIVEDSGRVTVETEKRWFAQLLFGEPTSSSQRRGLDLIIEGLEQLI
jgi:hypothetical protein